MDNVVYRVAYFQVLRIALPASICRIMDVDGLVSGGKEKRAAVDGDQ